MKKRRDWPLVLSVFVVWPAAWIGGHESGAGHVGSATYLVTLAIGLVWGLYVGWVWDTRLEAK